MTIMASLHTKIFVRATWPSMKSISRRPCVSYHVHKFSILSSQPSRRFCHPPQALDPAYDSDAHDFYQYTSGRWLWNEEEQLRERYRRFNVLELQNAAVKAVGSRSCTNIAKIGEGNFNKVFKLTMDNQSVVIARIPHPNAGPPTVTTASEVATMDFVCKYRCVVW